ncbi:MAG: hypothetical protein Q9214_000841 [Letrouitia sp. 1 TL-2023]
MTPKSRSSPDHDIEFTDRFYRFARKFVRPHYSLVLSCYVAMLDPLSLVAVMITLTGGVIGAVKYARTFYQNSEELGALQQSEQLLVHTPKILGKEQIKSIQDPKLAQRA